MILAAAAVPFSTGPSLRRGSLLSRLSHLSHAFQSSHLCGNLVVARAGVGDMLTRGIQGLFSAAAAQPDTLVESEARNLFFSDNAPSWEELEAMMKEKGMQLGDQGLTQEDFLESGPPNPFSLKRTFGKSDPIRVKLYRDHAAWCPYCQKVWLQLEEKRIPYTVEKINMRCYGEKPESFYEKTSSGLLPVMELDGQVFTESAVIADLLEKEFPDNPLLPPKGTPDRIRCSQLFRLERTTFSDWLQWLCRSGLSQQRRSRFDDTMKQVESELVASGGPFFLGERFSLADIVFAPFLERMDASLTYYKGFRMRGQGRYPALERWFAAMEERPTYIATRTDYYTHAFALPPQLGGCIMEKDGEPLAQQICGKVGGTWTLPLEPLSENSFEPYTPGDNPEHDTYYAAKKLITNREPVVKFALRGSGREGPRPVMAPLSDPTAEPEMEFYTATDTALRHVAHALLVGVDAKQSQPSQLITQTEAAADLLPSKGTIEALRYMRNRVGVPRDMKFPEARQLRAHLTWMLANVE